MQQLTTATPHDRLRFNRWLLSRYPRLTVLVDAPAGRVGVSIGDSPADWMPLDTDLTAIALQAGTIEAVDAAGSTDGLATIRADGSPRAGCRPPPG